MTVTETYIFTVVISGPGDVQDQAARLRDKIIDQPYGEDFDGAEIHVTESVRVSS